MGVDVVVSEARNRVSDSVLPAAWPAPPGVHALTTLRGPAGGSDAPFDRFNMGLRCGDDPTAPLRNRTLLREGLALPSEPRWLRQVHGTDVVRFDAVEAMNAVGAAEAAKDADRRTASRLPPLPREACLAEEPEADAAVTSEAGVVLAILTADCLPVVLAADDGGEIAAAHAGWRGLSAGVLEATVAAMRTPAERVQAWLGPAAGPQAYEIGEEVRAAFVDRDPRAAAAFVPTRPGHWRIDLYALARQRLADAGLTAEAVHGGGLCTIADAARFYSYRRDARTGRMATLVWIEG